MSEVNREVEPEQNSLVCKYTDPQRTHLQHMNPKNTWHDQKNVWKTFLTFQEQPSEPEETHDTLQKEQRYAVLLI